jgi:hypothetical protein
MKKSLVLLVLTASGFAPAFADTPAAGQAQMPQQSCQPCQKPADPKKCPAKKDEQMPQKAKVMLTAAEEKTVCPTQKKDEPKALAQTPVKVNPPKIALA